LLPELSQLIDLQEIDKEITEATQKLEQLPQEVEQQQRELEELEQAQAALLQQQEDLQRQRRETEAEVADLEAGIKKSRVRLMEIKSTIEHRAMLKEIAFKEDQRDQKETRVLELLELLEAQKQTLADQKRRFQELQNLLAERRREVEAQVKELQVQKAKMEGRRQTICRKLPPLLLKRYEFVRQRRNSTTVSEVRLGVCLGCHMNILPQQYIDLQKGEEILQCPHCQRILYWLGEEEEEEPEGKKPLSRSAS